MTDQDSAEAADLRSLVDEWRKRPGLPCCWIVFAALNIAMMVIGIERLDECPIEPMIPIYLIVSGSTSLSLLIVRLLVSRVLVPSLERAPILQGCKIESRSNQEKPDEPSSLVLRALTVYDSLATIFGTCWLVVGSVYVYSSHPDHADSGSDDYCDYTTYMFAFVMITISYVTLLLSMMAALLRCCFKKMNCDM